MTDFVGALSDFQKKAVPVLNNFFYGKLYPFIIAALVLIGHISGAEFWLNIIIVTMTSLSLLVCKTLKPLLATLFVIVYQVNLKHAPGIPYWSDYYLTNGKPVIFVILVLVLVSSIIYFSVKNVFPKLSFKKSPALLATVLLSAALLLNGAFSSEWSPGSLVFGFAEILVFFFLFYFLYHGLEGESAEELIDHFSYLSLLVAMVLVGEVAFAYLTYDNLFAPDGSVIKEALLFGWGVQNPMGFSLAVIIPPLMRGAIKSKYSLAYLAAAVLTWAAAILSMSRNAWICASAALVICLMLACFFSEKKRFYRIFTLAGAAVSIVGAIVFRHKIYAVLENLISKDAGDNGRFALWRKGIQNFLEAPIFGKGFFGYGETDVYLTIEFLPTMAHNTIIQLLSAMGIVGILSYAYYRVKTLTPFFRRPSFEKLMLLLVVLITLGASMLDNFVFYFMNAFPYIFALVLAFKLSESN